ncbi:hypothetical protein RHSIM_Rhsim09G0154700 [Rhododendron simsii]|uniref:F-box domain-containing protein n=1 Tax=Rhododendron simsii TaxID=118357 RepID=A0A834GJ00_RHOSS|nr:hypothetical protein RHSIM_Rhsim09G0154700 [Rhododendron simsii]
MAWFVKAKRELLGRVDRISQLPREILGAILSRLTLEEAGRTSVLSRSWRPLWAFLTTKLNFGAWKSRDEGVNICSPWYARRVNRVLKLHLGASVLDEFIIRFYPEEESSAAYYGDLDSWVNFAFQKGVKRLELDLASNGSWLYRWYAFPSVEKLCSRTSNTHPQLFGFCHLTTLCLNCVNITGEVIEHFLGNCPLLEQLQVISSDHLTNLKVAGPSLRLKCLEISRCYLEDLDISAANLASLSLMYFGPASRVILRNVPVLSELCISGDYAESVIHQPTDHLSYMRQLERLKLTRPLLFGQGVGRYIAFPPTYPELRCLKQLELESRKVRGENLIFYTPLVRACPLLSTFTVRYQSAIPPCDQSEVISATPINDDRYARVAPEYHHRCLQVVELVGFSGHPDEVEFLSYWLVMAVSLDKLVINPHAPSAVAMGLTYENSKIRAARECARQLQRKVPPRVKLVVL